MDTSIKLCNFVLIISFFLACSPDKPIEQSWCSEPLRSQFAQFEEIETNQTWFKVHLVGEGVYAIAEPYNFQEIISYLIVGDEQAVLFDTGMGLSSIATLARSLTDLPITVINSHTHYDHIGGNYEFDTILAMNTPYTLSRANNGIAHEIVQHEVASNAFCLEKLPDADTTNYRINPFPISSHIEDGSVINLGHRTLEVITVPGHTPDAIALYDQVNGYLWTGDTFYEAPIWLFDPETDLDVYRESIAKLAELSPELTTVFPAHNTPVAQPERLVELVAAFDSILDGAKLVDQQEDNTSLFEFEHFSFMIRTELLQH